MIFETISTTGHEEVVFCHNKDAGLKAIIAIHNTVLGPALGGTRMWPYASEQEALNDVLRLSRGMTYKAAVSGLNLGGGKAVIWGDPNKDKSEALFRSFGRFVNSLGGRYITAEDVGIDVNDMEYVFRETEYVTGVHQVHGGSGDPSPFTAYGTLQGLMAALSVKFGNEDVGKYSYAVQGVGHVGIEFVKLLRETGAKVFVTDINKAAVQRAVDEFGCEAVGLDDIYDVDADVYSPTALGGTVNEKTLPRLKCKVICGQQPAGHQRDRRRAGEEGHPLRARLRRERRWPDERVAGNRRLQPRARDAHDADDLLQPGPHLRDQPARRHPDLQGRRPHGRGAHQHHRQAQAAVHGQQ
jgi:leucine dehydrogenase